ncbi:MAG: uracil phosphoribosyltransferase [Prochlorothrix sp.]
MAPQLRIYVPPHPLIKHWLAVARDEATPSTLFRTAMKELGRWLTYEAVREWMPTLDTTVQTPLAPAEATFVNPEVPIAAVPILRAGLALWDGAQDLLPLASVYHLGLVRDEETFQAKCYLNRLPDRFLPQTQALVLDPMVATGGSLMAALEELVKRGLDPALIRVISVVAAPPALQAIGESYHTLTLYSAMIYPELNEKRYIVPGLGDAGDRSFGT